MSFINKYLRNFDPYKLASHEIWTADARARGHMLKIDWNEATIPPSPKVANQLARLVAGCDFYNLYPATSNTELLELLSAYTGLPSRNLQYFAGSDGLHEYIAKLYVSVGDPVLLLGPTYDNFRLTVEVCGGNVFYYNIGEDFIFDSAAFEATIDAVEPSLIYICNPNNPTGHLHTTNYIKYLLLRYPDTMFLVDEAYAEFSHTSVKDFVIDHENLLVSRTLSKAFALANFRFGYLIASESNIGYISSIRNAKNISTFAQEAAIGALSDVPYMERYVQTVQEGKAYFEEALKRYGWLSFIHGEGNFTLLVMEERGAKDALMGLLKSQGIYVRDLGQTDFLKERCIRVTIGSAEQMRRVVAAMDVFDEVAYENESRRNAQR